MNLQLLQGPGLVSCQYQLRKVAEPGSKVEIKCDYQVDVNVAKGLDRVSVRLTCRTIGDKSPFIFDVSMEAAFAVVGSKTKEEIEKIVFADSVVVIFPMLRDQIAYLTMKSGFPPFYIQPVPLDQLSLKEKTTATTDATQH